MSYFRNVTVDTDNATGDAFSRLRVSSPEYVFDTNFQYDLQPLVYEAVTNGSGTTTYADVNATYSAFEYNTAGTISGSPGLVIASAFIPASNQTKGAYGRGLSAKYPITLSQAAAVRAMGTVSIIATGYGGTSAIKAALTWKEIR